ncbi:MAG: aspartate kinase, partial [Bacteroidota bacterium]
PLHVKSFLAPLRKGTSVCKGSNLEPKVPCFIVKKNQVLLSLSSLDFSFIVEENISEIFKQLHHAKMKVGMIQNSAISFSVCAGNKFNSLEQLLTALKEKFKVSCYEDVSLYTIRHATDDAIKSIASGKTILLKQRLQDTVQIVAK